MAIPAGLTPIDSEQQIPAGLSPISDIPEGLQPVEDVSTMEDVAIQLPTGVARAYKEFGDTLGSLTAEVSSWFMSDTDAVDQKELAKEISHNIWAAIPFRGEEAADLMENLPKAETVAGGIAGSLTQAGTGFLLSKRIPSSHIKSKTLKLMMAGALTDFAFFDPYEERLSNLMTESDNPVFNNMVTQYLASDEDDPELEARMKQMLEGGIIGLAADRVIEGVKLIKGITQAKTDITKAGRMFDKLQGRITELREEGLNPNKAFSRAIREAGLSNDDAFNAALKSGRSFTFKAIQPTEKEIAKRASQASRSVIKNKILDVGKTAIDKTESALGALRTSIDNIDTGIGFRLQKFEYDSAQMAHRALGQVQPFLKGLSKLRGKQKDVYTNVQLHLANQNYKGVEELITSVKNPKLREQLVSGFKTTKEVIDALGKAGRKVNPELGLLDNYFPRAVKDYKGLARHKGFSYSSLERHLARASKRKDRSLTNIEIEEELNKFTRSLSVPKHGIRRPDGTKIRQIQYLKPEDLAYYAKPEEALTDYIHHMTHYVQKRRFFGYAKDNLDESIGHLLGQRVKEKSLTGEDIDKLTDLLSARFGKGEAAAGTGLQFMKNGFYAVTLNDPMNALTQVGDLAIAAHRHGVFRTINQTAKEVAGLITKDSRLHMRDLGLDRISEEFASTTRTAKYLNKLFKITGFKAIDTIGKNVHINAAFDKFHNWSQSKEGIQKFMAKYGPAFDDESLLKVIDDFRNNRVTDNTKFVVFNELADAQPITLSEQSKWYLEHPNGRILYTLRSFTLKQFDVLRRDAYNEIKKGNVAKGVGNLVRYATLFTIAGMGVDQTKAWILGRDIEPKENFSNNIWKMMGLSSYIVDKAKTDKTSTVISSLLLPPIGAGIDPITEDLKNFGETMNSLKVLPFGKLLYNYFGGGIEKNREWERKKKRRALRELVRE